MNQSSILSDTLIRLYKLVPRVKLYEKLILYCCPEVDKKRAKWSGYENTYTFLMTCHIISFDDQSQLRWKTLTKVLNISNLT